MISGSARIGRYKTPWLTRSIGTGQPSVRWPIQTSWSFSVRYSGAGVSLIGAATALRRLETYYKHSPILIRRHRISFSVLNERSAVQRRTKFARRDMEQY